MDYATSLTLFWLTLHFVGLMTAWSVRMQSGSRYEAMAQAGFFLSLLVVSAVTLVGLLCCFEFWHFSAVTLAAMVLLAVVDFRLDRPQPVRA